MRGFSPPLAALICIPLGFLLPYIYVLQKLDAVPLTALPLAVGIWLVGSFIIFTNPASENTSRGWRLVALSVNTALALIALAIYLFVGGLTVQ